jgi:hypothetical protein
MTLGFPTLLIKKILACIPIDRSKKIGTICVQDTCHAAQTAQSLALEDPKDYPTSARLNQWQPKHKPQYNK